jgi:hypothetical protein
VSCSGQPSSSVLSRMSSPTLTERVQRTISASMHHPLTVLGASLHWLQASCPVDHSPRVSASAQKVLVSTDRGNGRRRVPVRCRASDMGSMWEAGAGQPCNLAVPLGGNGLHEGERTTKVPPRPRFNKQAGSRARQALRRFSARGGEAGCAAYMELV